ncbi:MAG TPA: bifunctional phosphoribosylaminoimidazolecarboxamide formyltransferase/IMP cyclohydrolase [Bryobacteraceae bacterium]|nr:bifunctional phosphoribosylaminoimidazolecarboxamide formyltransferase/IMP cyclohydrolase [Bryobacteraceae bacterium]
MPKIKRVLISVTDKTGVVEFARGLSGLGAEIVSTGGTARMIREAGVPVKDVAEVTGFPEMLDGRVKTLHPKVAGGILAMRSHADHMAALAAHGITPIDMVVVNLYRFEEAAAKEGIAREDLIENIDIGGPTMIRAAAKNYQDVAVVVAPADYPGVLDELRASGGELSVEACWKLAKKAFRTTADYDSAISTRLEQGDAPAAGLPAALNARAPKLMDLRYGENPHQGAALYGVRGSGIAGAEQLHGKELSYNNLVDLDAAFQLVMEFDRPAIAIIKHTNPCGCAEQDSLAEAWRQALACDPVSAFGGVVGINRTVDEEAAREISALFVEAIAAPDYSPEALAILKAKRNLRLMRVTPGPAGAALRSISGGYLVQTADTIGLDRRTATVQSKRQPTEHEWAAMVFAWKVAKHVKSNAIVFAREGQTLAVGAGQMSRVDSVKIAGMKAVLPLADSVVASDAFFPFADGVEEAAKLGATAFIQPGGSVRDRDVIDAVDRLGAAMVFTGVRHFRH